MQLQGFTITAISLFMITLSSTELGQRWWALTIGMYAVSVLSYGFGPAPCTFMMPSLLFPSPIRATVNGLAAAIGKRIDTCMHK